MTAGSPPVKKGQPGDGEPPRDIFDTIDETVAGITDADVEGRLQETLRSLQETLRGAAKPKMGKGLSRRELVEQRRAYLGMAATAKAVLDELDELDALDAGHGGEPHDESHSGDPEHPEEPRQPPPAAAGTAARQPSKQPRRTTRAARRRGKKD